jgi:uncharacterized repeat protein (TIGR01451 family)
MKNLTQILCCIILILGFSTPSKAQGWEFFVTDTSFSNSSEFRILSGANNDVRLAHKNDANGTVNMINYDADGDFIEEYAVPDTENWFVIQSDNSGATYWYSDYKVRKTDINNQIVWTFNAPIATGNFWVSPGPNGSSYSIYFDNNGNYVIDIIDKDGILGHRFNTNYIGSFTFLPTGDLGIIYPTNISGTGSMETWTRFDPQGNIIWSKELNPDLEVIVMGSTDGSTYIVNANKELVKLDASLNVVWIKPLNSNMLDIDMYLNSIIELSDGNIAILSIGGHFSASKGKLKIIKMDAQTGALIWEKRPTNDTEWLSGNCGFFEMADGGLLTAFDTYSPNTAPLLFIMRTDQNGNTLTNQINGRLYQDENADCQWQNTDNVMKQVSIIAQSGSKTYSATTDSLGNFSMAAGSGNYQISYGQLGSYWGFCTTPTVSLAATNDTVVFNAGVIALVNCPELVVSIGSNVFRRCFDNNYLNISYQNIGSAPAENAYVELFLDPKLEFLSATPIAAIQNGQTFRFELGTLAVGASGQISVNFKVDCNAEIEEILCASAHIYPDTLCLPVAPRHSENQFCLPVVASYDPNDKTAFLNGRPEFSKILPNEELEYLIRFQNTGNDTAFNIVIVDTLTTYLDASSVLPGVSSHPYSFELDKGHILRFSFRNILLPDSNTNEVASHGFVKFRVHQNPNNVLGNEIKNSAAIFFDYNAPIITNETNLKISIPSRTADLENRVYAQIFPIPAREKVQVSLKNADAGTVLWRMFDTTGKLISNGQSSGTTGFDIPRNGQPSGVYYCQFLMGNGQTVFGKVIFD